MHIQVILRLIILKNIYNRGDLFRKGKLVSGYIIYCQHEAGGSSFPKLNSDMGAKIVTPLCVPSLPFPSMSIFILILGVLLSAS